MNDTTDITNEATSTQNEGRACEKNTLSYQQYVAQLDRYSTTDIAPDAPEITDNAEEEETNSDCGLEHETQVWEDHINAAKAQFVATAAAVLKAPKAGAGKKKKP